MDATRASTRVVKAKSMNPIASTNSSGISSVLAAGSAAQFLGQSAGFATALAAAQEAQNPPLSLGRGTGAAAAIATSAPIAPGNAAALATAAPGVPAKKLLNNAPAGAANLIPSTNPVVPSSPLPALSPCPSPSTIVSLAPSVLSVAVAEVAAGSTLQSGIPAAPTPAGRAAPASPGISFPLPSFGDGPSLPMPQASSSAAKPQVNAIEGAAAEQIPAPMSPSKIAGAEVAATPGSLPNASQGSVPEADATATNADPLAPAVTLDSNAQPLPNAASSGALSLQQLDPAGDNSVPVLLASANSASAAPASGNPPGLWGGANLQGAAALPSQAAPAPDVATQWGPAQAAINSSLPLVALPIAPLPVSTGLLPIPPAASGKPASPFAAARGNPATTNPTGSAAAQSGGTAASRGSFALPSFSSEAANSTAANDPGQQTPFAVFFSNSAGAESAAAAWPRMMLPPTGGAIQGNQSPAATAAGAKNNNLAGAVLQPAATNPKSTTVAEATTPPPAPTQQSIAVTAASAQPNPAQTAGGQAPAPAASGATAMPPAPIGPSGDALPSKAALPTASSNATAPASPLTEMPAIPATGAVQMAQLVSQAGQSEMRIGMNTAAFGSVEVRTVVHAGEVGLVIGSEKGDLRSALANEMPTITTSLQQQNLRLNSVSYMQGFAFSNDFSGGGGSQQRSFIPSPAPSYASAAVGTDDPAEGASMAAFVGGTNSLSILA